MKYLPFPFLLTSTLAFLQYLGCPLPGDIFLGLKVLTNEKREGLAVVSFDRLGFKGTVS